MMITVTVTHENGRKLSSPLKFTTSNFVSARMEAEQKNYQGTMSDGSKTLSLVLS